MHTVAILLTVELGNPPLQLARLATYNDLHTRLAMLGLSGTMTATFQQAS